MKRRIVSVASLLVPAVLLTAQTDRITVRMSPAPNQTLHQRTTQVIAMTTEPKPGGTGALPLVPQAINMTMTMDVTSTVGPPNNQGHYEARVVCDSASMTATLNGQPMPMPQLSTEKAVGQLFTFTYDDQGKVINVETDGVLAGAAAAALKQMLTSALATAAPITLSVGETVTVPTLLNVPLPAAAPGGAGGPMTVSGETQCTLTSVTFDGADRIAHLAMKITSAVNSALPAGGSAPTIAVDIRMTGEGTSDVNVDRGIVLHKEQRMTVDASTNAEANPRMPNMRGTITLTTDLLR